MLVKITQVLHTNKLKLTSQWSPSSICLYALTPWPQKCPALSMPDFSFPTHSLANPVALPFSLASFLPYAPDPDLQLQLPIPNSTSIPHTVISVWTYTSPWSLRAGCCLSACCLYIGSFTVFESNSKLPLRRQKSSGPSLLYLFLTHLL